MNDRDPQFRTDHRAGGSRVHVADDDDPVRPFVETYLLVGNHDVTSLFGMCTTADTEVIVGLRYAEVLKDRIGHVAIVVLPGVDQ